MTSGGSGPLGDDRKNIKAAAIVKSHPKEMTSSLTNERQGSVQERE